MSQDWRNKAILVRLTVGSWSGNAGQRKCRQIAAEVEEQHGTAHGKIKADAELLAKEDRGQVIGPYEFHVCPMRSAAVRKLCYVCVASHFVNHASSGRSQWSNFTIVPGVCTSLWVLIETSSLPPPAARTREKRGNDRHVD